MIKHIVFYKLKEYSKDNAQKLCDMFMSMDGKVPKAKNIVASKDALRSERSFDVSLEVSFDSMEDMAEYQVSAYHVEVVKAYVHSVIEKSVCVDYEY